jgi:hypothetical protein
MVMVVVPLPIGHPKTFSRPTKNISRDRPITTSGMTNGAVIAPINRVLPRNLSNLVITIAAMVPKITDMVAERLATLRLVNVARKIIGFDTSDLYHRKEKPVQVDIRRDSLNE